MKIYSRKLFKLIWVVLICILMLYVKDKYSLHYWLYVILTGIILLLLDNIIEIIKKMIFKDKT